MEITGVVDLTLGGSIFTTSRFTRSSPFHACSSHVQSAHGDSSFIWYPLRRHEGVHPGLLIKGRFTVRTPACLIHSHLALDTMLARAVMLIRVIFWPKIGCTCVITGALSVLLRSASWLTSAGHLDAIRWRRACLAPSYNCSLSGTEAFRYLESFCSQARNLEYGPKHPSAMEW